MYTQRKKNQRKVPRKLQNSSNCCISPRMKMQLDSLGNGSRLVWSLSSEQISYIELYYNYSVEPHLYKIKTIRELPNFITKTPAILKKLLKGAHDGNSHIIGPLKKQDISVLNKLGIAYTPVKYAISTIPNY